MRLQQYYGDDADAPGPRCPILAMLNSVTCKLPVFLYHASMPRKSLEIAVADLTQAIGLLVRRVRAAAASHELSLTESAVMARLARRTGHDRRSGARGRHEAAVDGRHRRGA